MEKILCRISERETAMRSINKCGSIEGDRNQEQQISEIQIDEKERSDELYETNTFHIDVCSVCRK